MDTNETCSSAGGDMQDGEYSQAQSIIQISKKLQDDLYLLGMKIKLHEDNLKLLKTLKNKMDDSILDMQVTIGKYYTNIPKLENEDLSPASSEEDANEQILQHENSAAGIFCQLKTRYRTKISDLAVTKDIMGVVAALGKVDDENLSRLFSEYLGVETMLAIVCKTYEGVKALETYDKEGFINKNSGLHGLGSSVGRALEGRFLVICLESLRPYPGEFVTDDPQRRLDILKPRLPNGECPAGFLGFAVNMIKVDRSNLFCLTPSGYGFRETLFYHLFCRLQVYKTRADMMQALPCVSDGAVSLDGGMIRSNGVFYLGNREDVSVRFPSTSAKLNQPEGCLETEKEINETKWRKEKIVEDMKRENALLDVAKFNFEKKKNEFLQFVAESSSFATQHQVHAAQDRVISQ